MAYKYPYNEEEKAYKPPMLKTDRSMWKLMILSFFTLDLYSIFFFMPFSYDLDTVAPKKDRSKTTSFIFAYLLSLFTFRIVMLIWHYQIAQRIEEALAARNIDYEFDVSKDFWGWYFFGSFILIGPFVYFHKICKAMNLLCQDYNENPTRELDRN